MSKLEENKVDVNRDEVYIAELCKQVSDELSHQLKAGQQILYSCDPETLSILSDGRILKNILFNLISNASKYSSENKPIHCVATESNGEVEISIRDEGMGIPVEEQKHLFTRFFRASNAINIKGTGLGLHIVQQYLDLVGGRIAFNSRQGEGSTFTIKLKKHTNG